MYSHSHVHFAQKITGSSNTLLLLGSIFPDLHQEGLMPQNFDRKVIDLLRFFKEKHPEFLPFAIGMALHEYPIGVDRFIHTSYKNGPGYAFSFTEELCALSIQTFNCDERLGVLASHFLVEKAIEIKILKKHPELKKTYRDMMDDPVLEKLFSVLCEFYQISNEDLMKEWNSYKHVSLDYDLSSVVDLAKEMSFLYNKIYSVYVLPKKIEPLIELAIVAIEPTIDEFLKYCLEECKKDFEFNFGKLKSVLKD